MEVLQAAVAALNRGDVDAFVGCAHPETEWETTGLFLEAGTYRGRSGVRGYATALPGEFDELHVEADVVATSGDMVVVDARVRGTGKRGGVPVDIAFASVIRFKDGLIYRLRNFETKDRDQALEAVGLRE